MSQSFDLSQFPDLPPEVVQAFVAQSAALEAARFEASVGSRRRSSARRGPHEQAVVAEKPEGQVGQYRHAKFGPKSEKLGPAQLKLAL